MIKVITYGTFDLLHHGHIKLLERAKALGDYLIVGVTAEDFDKTRGKINVQQSIMERVEAVRATGIADEIIIEEYEGQKIDDIRRYDVDIFTVGSDWIGKFDYLSEYCEVKYLERTEGVSSSEIRAEKSELIIGLVGEPSYLEKFIRESAYVNGVTVSNITDDYEGKLDTVDAVYVVSHPTKHYEQIKAALEMGKHVLCETPIALKKAAVEELFDLAKVKNCVLMEALKTAYSTAFYRLILLAKSGVIGDIVSVDATCTSLKDIDVTESANSHWSSLTEWGPIAMLPVFQLLGTKYSKKEIVSKIPCIESKFDLFTKINFLYPHATATIKVGKGVKSEGELVISGTKGYIYVPAPWWKTDYFEVRYENPENNRRHFYQLDGEGIRYQIVAFSKAIEMGRDTSYISKDVSLAFASIMEDFYNGADLHVI